MAFENIGDRVRDALREAQVSQKDFAAHAGTSNGFVSEVCRGVKRPSLEILSEFVTRYGVSGSWLLAGIGPMHLRDLEDQPASTPVQRAAAGVQKAAADVVAAAVLLDTPLDPPMASDVEVRWDKLVDGATSSLREEGRKLLHQASASAPVGRARSHSIYALVDRLVAECPEDVERAEVIIDALVRRCAGGSAARSA